MISKTIANFESLESRRLLADVPNGFTDTSFAVGITAGTQMAFAPDGRIFVVSQGGPVQIVQRNGTVSTALNLRVNNSPERGLVGIAVSPDFATTGHIFLYYTELPANQAVGYTGTTTNRISRFTVSGNTINANSEVLIARLDTLTTPSHNGGGMAFGPDGKLYVGVGENDVKANSQSGSNRLGKVLRFNPDGSIPSDNPTTIPGLGTLTGANRAIFAAGLRNPYTLAFDPVDGTLLINDVGSFKFEEINLGLAGQNYGWPTTEGPFDANAAGNTNFTNPLYAYQRGATDTTGNSVTGGAFYRSDSQQRFPDSFSGKYFFGDFVTGWINMIDPKAPPNDINRANVFATETPGIVDLDVGPDGALYYLQRGGTNPGIRRIAAVARPTYSLSSTGTLWVDGTSADDEIIINRKGAKVRLISNGNATLFSNSKVKRIRVSAGAGNDVVKLGAGVRSLGADGGTGNDFITGGDYADNIVGGDGLDTIYGYGGDDLIDGGDGRDVIVAGAGNDSITGGTAVDKIDGGLGTDRSDEDDRETRVSIEVLA